MEHSRGTRHSGQTDRLHLVATLDKPGTMTPAEHRQDLMARSARGDQKAFAELYDDLAPQVFGTIKRILRDPAQSEEVTQEVMVELWRTAPRYDGSKGSVATWAATLAHRRAVDRVRGEQAWRDRTERDAQDRPTTTGDIGDEVVDAFVADFDRQRVARALERLTPTQRESVELAFYGGHTHAEVAALLDLPLGTVKTRIRDGLIRLRDGLGAAS
jgi:RNA polymerase sigma-70 factor (ECF subfamily)